MIQIKNILRMRYSYSWNLAQILVYVEDAVPRFALMQMRDPAKIALYATKKDCC
jgi:hypothetical protein